MSHFRYFIDPSLSDLSSSDLASPSFDVSLSTRLLQDESGGSLSLSLSCERVLQSHEAEVVFCLSSHLSQFRLESSSALLVSLYHSDSSYSLPLSWQDEKGQEADEVYDLSSPLNQHFTFLHRLKRLLKKEKLLQEAQQRMHALEVASDTLNRVHDEKTIFERLVEILVEQLQSRRISVLKVNREQGELVMKAAHGIPKEIIAQARPKIGQGIAGQCAKNGQPIYIADHEQYRQKGHFKTILDHKELPLSLTVPIWVRGEVVGVVNVTDRANGVPYSHQEVAFISALMSHAGYLMESTTLIEDLKALQSFSAQVIHTLQDPLIVLNQRGQCIRFNSAFQALFQTVPDGIEFLEKEYQTPILKALSIQETWSFKGWSTQSKVFDLRLIPFDDQSDRALLFFQDVTERQQMGRQLVSAEKLASLGILSAGIAHEINNPLGFVKTNTKEAQRYFDDLLEIIDAWHQYAQDHQLSLEIEPRQIEAEVELSEIRNDIPTLIRENLDGLDRMQKIIKSLKSFAHPDTEQTKEIQLDTLVDHALVITQGQWKHHLVIEKDCTPHPSLSAIPNQLEQVFMNLIVNAAHAARDLGEKQGHRKRAQMKIHSQVLDSHWVQICFEDRCGGIPAEVVERIFDPFFTTKDIGEGTGLGLHIAHNIIEGHGGEIKVESHPPTGTCFRITLPLDQGASQKGPLVIKQLSRFKV